MVDNDVPARQMIKGFMPALASQRNAQSQLFHQSMHCLKSELPRLAVAVAAHVHLPSVGVVPF